MAISLLLPVVTTMEPDLFDSAMSSVPRMRDCRFSSVLSSASPSNGAASWRRKASKSGVIGISVYFTPWIFAISRASSMLICAVYCDGIITACTRSGPSASTHTASTSAESMPPDSPRITPGKRFLFT